MVALNSLRIPKMNSKSLKKRIDQLKRNHIRRRKQQKRRSGGNHGDTQKLDEVGEVIYEPAQSSADKRNGKHVSAKLRDKDFEDEDDDEDNKSISNTTSIDYEIQDETRKLRKRNLTIIRDLLAIIQDLKDHEQFQSWILELEINCQHLNFTTSFKTEGENNEQPSETESFIVNRILVNRIKDLRIQQRVNINYSSKDNIRNLKQSFTPTVTISSMLTKLEELESPRIINKEKIVDHISKFDQLVLELHSIKRLSEDEVKKQNALVQEIFLRSLRGEFSSFSANLQCFDKNYVNDGNLYSFFKKLTAWTEIHEKKKQQDVTDEVKPQELHNTYYRNDYYGNYNRHY